MDFKIIGAITDIRVIAKGARIRERRRLWKVYGRGVWRKLKGTASIKLGDDTMVKAELHWYEAHGIGKKEFKIKRIISEDE